MSDLKSTPGPWGWQKFGDQYCLTAQHGMREIIISANPVRNSVQPMVVMNNDGILQPVNPDHPNAKLIASAPLLREENEKLKARISEFETQKEDFNEEREAIIKNWSRLYDTCAEKRDKLESDNEALVKRVAELEEQLKSVKDDVNFWQTVKGSDVYTEKVESLNELLKKKEAKIEKAYDYNNKCTDELAKQDSENKRLREALEKIEGTSFTICREIATAALKPQQP